MIVIRCFFYDGELWWILLSNFMVNRIDDIDVIDFLMIIDIVMDWNMACLELSFKDNPAPGDAFSGED